VVRLRNGVRSRKTPRLPDLHLRIWGVLFKKQWVARAATHLLSERSYAPASVKFTVMVVSISTGCPFSI
jgi:hypothetical protein